MIASFHNHLIAIKQKKGKIHNFSQRKKESAVFLDCFSGFNNKNTVISLSTH